MASKAELGRMGLDGNALQCVVGAAETWHQELQSRGGLQVAVFKDGELALSLWEGRDIFNGRPIQRDSLFPILSATKGVAAIGLLHLHHLGYFDWRDRIAQYWPRFERHGKANATIRHLLSHRVGIPLVTAHWTRWTDRAFMTALMEEARPEWEPGTRYGYHGGSWGVVVDELVRRWTGGSLGEVVRDLARRVSAANCYLGLPRSRYGDVARLAYLEPEQLRAAAALGPIGPYSGYNSLGVLTTCQPSGGAVSSAEDLARVYGLMAAEGAVTSGRVWSRAAQAEAVRACNDLDGEEPAARPELRFAWGLGFMVSPSRMVYGTVPPSAWTAGHPGASGAVGYADPAKRLSVGLTVNGVGGQHMYARYQTLGDLIQSAF